MLILFSLISICCNAQTFELTPLGFVDSKNAQNDYIVVPFEGKSQTEIFNLALTAIGKTFVSPDDRISKVKYNQININGVFQDITFINRVGLKLYFDMYYNIIFEFKDGKMRINGPIINDIRRQAPDGVQHICLTKADKGWGDKVLFNNDGKINEKKHKENIEDTVNTFVNKIISEMNKTKESDW